MGERIAKMCWWEDTEELQNNTKHVRFVDTPRNSELSCSEYSPESKNVSFVDTQRNSELSCSEYPSPGLIPRGEGFTRI